MTRPLVAVPARLAASTSALRYAAAVNARALLTMVHAAGGEPLSTLPWPDGRRLGDEELDERLGFADGVLLPGGGDLDPHSYGESLNSSQVYDVDNLQDVVDLQIASWALERGVPLLAVCRGMHVVNVALGGSLEQHMSQPHRDEATQEVRQRLTVLEASWPDGVSVPDELKVSCFHHQRIGRLADGLTPLAAAGDGTTEAVAREDGKGWFLGVQWHPEDMSDDPQQQSIMEAFVAAAQLQQNG